MQILTYAEGKLGLALIPDRLRRLLAADAELLKTQATLVTDYHPAAANAALVNISTDRLSVFALPEHDNRPEYLVRFQRGLLAWSVLVSGLDNFVEFDRRFVQPFVPTMRAASHAPMPSGPNMGALGAAGIT